MPEQKASTVNPDLFELDPAMVKAAASLLANRLIRVARPRTPEQTLRIAFQGAVDEIARKLKFNLNWRDEYHLIEGRADTVWTTAKRRAAH
ncbi:MAG: hypothetical protein ABSA97_02815 [Verrucomicrobiia bacterium]|jgi:hypothetical protein